jgi:hypothetical protein
MFEYYTFKNKNEEFQFVSFPKKKSTKNLVLCTNRHKVIDGKIYVSYIFSDKLLTEVNLIDQRVEELITKFREGFK